MLSKFVSRPVVGGLIAAVVASAAVVPGAYAQDLRSADARDAGQPATPAAHDLRSADARVPEAFPSITQEPPVGVPSPPSGFDWASAAIGAAAGTGLLIVVVAGISLPGPAGRRQRTFGAGS